jgi:hypothetical protein
MNKDVILGMKNTNYPLLPKLPKRKYKKKWQASVKKAKNYFVPLADNNSSVIMP